MPSTEEEWLEVENGFKSNFPHALGAIDGKHVTMVAPTHSGSTYFNYKKTFSIVLLALVNSKYEFMFADVGGQGRISDGGILQNSVLWDNITKNKLNLPKPRPLPGSQIALPYVVLGDGAFALTPNIMKPFPGDHVFGSVKRTFNYTLSKSRVIVENTFGILASRFRVFRRPFALQPDKVAIITLTCILLHNFLMKSNSSNQVYNSPGTIDTYDNNGDLLREGSWRQEVDEHCAIRSVTRRGRRPTVSAVKIRNEFAEYFYNKS